VNLSWEPSEDVLLHYTWSQGFRAGGFNKSFEPYDDSPLGVVHQSDSALHGQAGRKMTLHPA